MIDNDHPYHRYRSQSNLEIEFVNHPRALSTFYLSLLFFVCNIEVLSPLHNLLMILEGGSPQNSTLGASFK